VTVRYLVVFICIVLIKPEQVPGLHHVRWQWRRYIDYAARRVGNTNPARMQMQAVLDTARKRPVGVRFEIFRIADEFSAQEKEIDPARMPATRLANTAIDGIVNDPQAVLEDVLRFASSDMLCYRAGSPERLVNRQTELWDPLIDWAASDLGARFVLAEGVIHVEQPREALGAFSVHLGQFNDPFAIAALHTITTLTGSAILALAVAKGEITGAESWKLAHVDEDWTIEHWGEDAEAAARRAVREREMMAAVKMLEAVSAS